MLESILIEILLVLHTSVSLIEERLGDDDPCLLLKVVVAHPMTRFSMGAVFTYINFLRCVQVVGIRSKYFPDTRALIYSGYSH